MAPSESTPDNGRTRFLATECRAVSPRKRTRAGFRKDRRDPPVAAKQPLFHPYIACGLATNVRTLKKISTGAQNLDLQPDEGFLPTTWSLTESSRPLNRQGLSFLGV